MLINKNHLGCAFFALICLFSATFAQKTEISDEKRKVIAEIITVTKADKRVEEVMMAMMTQMDQMYPLMVRSVIKSRDDLTTAQKEEVERIAAARHSTFSTRFQEKLTKAINFQEYINSVFYPLYDKFFTEGELRDLLAFYKTPTGQKLNELTPQFTAESLKLSQEYLLPKVQQIVIELVSEDTDKSPPPPAKSDN